VSVVQSSIVHDGMRHANSDIFVVGSICRLPAAMYHVTSVLYFVAGSALWLDQYLTRCYQAIFMIQHILLTVWVRFQNFSLLSRLAYKVQALRLCTAQFTTDTDIDNMEQVCWTSDQQWRIKNVYVSLLQARCHICPLARWTNHHSHWAWCKTAVIFYRA